jgi:hypothetical protein
VVGAYLATAEEHRRGVDAACTAYMMLWTPAICGAGQGVGFLPIAQAPSSRSRLGH